MAGNIGTQASALTVMALSNKKLDFKNVLLEGMVGVFTGIICSLIIGIATYIFVKDINIVFNSICIITYKYDNRSDDWVIYTYDV
ncbi:hypothetical protein Q5M85_00335 [Paraclostridium bifermentans]|nr:hypothetical protein [Paraclostridium bifermentans]